MALKRAVVQIELLFDDEIEDPTQYENLRDIANSIVDGHVSGNWGIVEVEPVTRSRMARLLEAQGSDPDFLLAEEE